MVQEPEVNIVTGVTKVIDTLLNFKMDSKEFLSNEKIVSKIGTAIDNLNATSAGHALLSITRDKVRNLLLITKESNTFTLYKWKINETIDKVVGVEVHEEDASDEVPKFIYDNSNGSLHRGELASALVNESLNGFSTNKNIAKQLINIKNKDERIGPVSKDMALAANPGSEYLITLGRKVIANTDKAKSDIKKSVEEIAKKNKVDININHSLPTYGMERAFVGEITSVKEIGGRRHFEVKWVSLKKFTDQVRYGRVTASCSPAVSSASIETHKNVYVFTKREYQSTQDIEYNPLHLEYLPYNLVDKGRLIIGIPENNHEWKTIISPDPRVDANFKETFERDAISFISKEIEDSYSINGSNIKIDKLSATMSYNQYEDTQKRLNPELSGLRLKLKAMKVMVEEHNYLVKKNDSIGEDVTITENIKYNHKEGKIAYNDFSIAVNDEYIKAKLYSLFNHYLMNYYRSEQTEQDILDAIIKDTFNAIDERINTGAKVELDLPIRINDQIDIHITGKVSKRYAADDADKEEKDKTLVSSSQLFYINDRRFNKNEVLMVLKEMTCYRSQAEADAFIQNIGRLGLSSYIGISTGYEVNFSREPDEPDNKLFRFKKLKGRSNYELMLDDTTIPIRGKKLINILYSEFIGDRVPDFIGKIPTYIYECSGSSLQYLKYKVLIDSTYKAFKDKSKEYLTKKVVEVGGENVKYYNKKARKLLDAIRLTGASGKNYIIAYDSRDSYVFMDATKEVDEDEYNTKEEVYKEGKYICMIDQSNIKSNISYDTIVAKLLALKNDSSIAHTIYNLQEELE